MSRASLRLACAACLLGACDDGVLPAFERRVVAPGGAGGTEPMAEAGGGRGGTTPVDPPAGAGPTEPISPLLVDNFEDGDFRSEEPRGWWYPVNDKTSVQGLGINPVSRGTTSAYSLQTYGSGFGDWGAALGVNLVGDATPLNLYGYAELCFSARVDPGTSNVIEVHLLREAEEHYSRQVTLSESWSRHCVPLSEFKQPDEAPLVPTDLIALQFFFTPDAPFAFWLDDVEAVP